jgi:hypothetical protein
MKHGKAPIRGGNVNTMTEEELDLLPEAHRQLAKAQVEKDFESHFAADMRFVEGDESDDHSDRSEQDVWLMLRLILSHIQALPGKPMRVQLADGSEEEARADDEAKDDEGARHAKKPKTSHTFEIPRIGMAVLRLTFFSVSFLLFLAVVTVYYSLLLELSSEAPVSVLGHLNPNPHPSAHPVEARPVEDAETAATIRSLRCRKVDVANEFHQLSSQLDLAKSMQQLEKSAIMKVRRKLVLTFGLYLV